MSYKKTLKSTLTILLALMMVFTSVQFAVAADTANIGSNGLIQTDKAIYTSGEEILVTADGSGTDWVGIFPKGTTNYGTSIYWYYVSGNNENFNLYNGTKNSDLGLGEYDVILFSNDSYTVLDRVTVTIEALTEVTYDLSVEKDTVTSGEAINVTASCSLSDAWVGIYEKGSTYDPNNGGVTSVYWYSVSNYNGIAFDILSGEPNTGRSMGIGEYEIVLFGDGGYSYVLDTVCVTVEEPDDVTLDMSVNKTTFIEGEDILVTATGYGNAWVGLYLKGETPCGAVPSVYWYYVDNTYLGFTGVSGETYNIKNTLNDGGRTELFGLPAGEYSLKLFDADGSYTVLKNIDITIKKLKINLSSAEITVADATYTGEAVEPTVTVVIDGKTLVKNTDYTLTYSNNTDEGEGKVTVTGIGDYEGSVDKTFTISKTDIANAEITVTDATYSGEELKPTVIVVFGGQTLTEGTDYELVYSDNIEVGIGKVTVNGIGLFKGSTEKTFTISEKPKTDISGATVKVDDTVYTGEKLKPTVTVVLGDKTLVENTDYQLTYSNNIYAGTGKVTVIGIGDYEESAEGSFTISPADLTGATVTVADATYTGEAVEPAVTVVLNGKTLVKDTDYELVYSDNIDAGTGKVTVTGINNYTGSADKGFTIIVLLSTDKDTYESGEAINVTATVDEATVKAGAWVGIYEKGSKYDPNKGGVTSVYWYNVSDSNGTAFNILNGIFNVDGRPMGVGEYEIVLFGDGGYTNVLDKVTVTIELPAEPISEISVEKTTFKEGEDILVTAASDYPGAWVGLYKDGEAVETYLSIFWYYVSESNGKAFNILEGDATNGRQGEFGVGNYKLVLFKDGGYTVDKTINITVEEADTSNTVFDFTINENTVENGETLFVVNGDKIVINASAIGGDTGLSWLGIYNSQYGKDHDYSTTPAVNFDYIKNINGEDWDITTWLAQGPNTVAIFADNGYSKLIKLAYIEVTRDDIESEEIITEATCESSGLKHLVYEDGTEEDIVIFPLGHNYDEGVEIEATPYEIGGLKKTCGRCQGTLLENETKFDIENAEIIVGKAINDANPEVTVMYNGTKLVESVHYEISYAYYGTAQINTAVVTGIGNCTGFAEKEYTIEYVENKYDLSNAEITVDNAIYTGEEVKPSVTVVIDGKTLIENTDYELVYSDNIEAGTGKVAVTGIGEYIGTVSKTFTISKIDLSDAVITVADATYTGVETKPTVKVVLGGKALVENTDYQLAYSDNINAGIGKVIVTGIGKYDGSIDKTFVIEAKTVKPTVTLPETEFVYNGKVQKPVLTVKYGDKTIATTDYTVKFDEDGKNVGKYTVTVTLKGNYAGTATTEYTINPKTTKIKKLIKAKKAITVKWAKKKSQTTGYQIILCTKKNFKKGTKIVTIKKNNIGLKTIKGLKANKKYFVKIRTFKKVGNTKHYSAWSKVKSVKTK